MKIHGIILAAGYGKRMEVICDCTKNLFAPGKAALPVGKRSLVRQQLYMLHLMGIPSSTVVVKYKADSVVRAIGDQSKFTMKVDTFDMDEHKVEDWGAAWTVNCWLQTQEEKPDAVVVLNGDILWDKKIAPEFTQALLGSNAMAQIAAARTPLQQIFGRFGLVQTEQASATNPRRVIGFTEKPTQDQYAPAMGDLANVGIFAIRSSVFEYFGQQFGPNFADFASHLFEKGMLNHDLLLNAYCLGQDFYWKDIGTPLDLLQANLDVLNGKVDAGPQGEKVDAGPQGEKVDADPQGEKVEGKSSIFVGKDCQIADSALGKMHGRVIIGDNVYIGKGADISNSVIGSGWQIMPFAKIKNSVLLPGFYGKDNQRVVSSHSQLDHVIACGGIVAPYNPLSAYTNKIIVVSPDMTMAWYDYDFSGVK